MDVYRYVGTYASRADWLLVMALSSVERHCTYVRRYVRYC